MLEWTFITSQFEGMVEQLDSFNGEALQIDATPVDKARLAAVIEAAAAGMARAAGALAQARLALAGAGADELPARRLAAQQAAASQQTEAAAQFDAVYSLIFQGSYRPTLPQVEISAITGKGQRLALLLESPEPMNWTRLACKLQVLKSSGVYTDLKDILLVWNEDGTKLLLLPTNRPTVPGESLRLHFAYTLDLGAEAPVQRRNGSTLPEVAALHFVLA